MEREDTDFVGLLLFCSKEGWIISNKNIFLRADNLRLIMEDEEKKAGSNHRAILLLSVCIAITIAYIIYHRYYPRDETDVTESYVEAGIEQENPNLEIQASVVTSSQTDLPTETTKTDQTALDTEIAKAKRLNQQLSAEIGRVKKLNSQLEAKLSNPSTTASAPQATTDNGKVKELEAELSKLKQQNSQLETRIAKLEKALSAPASSTAVPTAAPTQKLDPNKVYVEVTGKKGKVMLYEGMSKTEALQLMGNPDELSGSGGYRIYKYCKNGESYSYYTLRFYNDKLESISQ